MINKLNLFLNKNILVFYLSLFSILSEKVLAQTENKNNKQIIANIHTFAKLYGYIRYFHPSDEAQSIDWDKFIVYGINQVKKAPTNQLLKQTLEDLFLPIAPTLQIYGDNQNPIFLPKSKQLLDSVLVTWQHQGYGLNEFRDFKSLRLGRINDTILTQNRYQNSKKDSLFAEKQNGHKLGILFEKYAKYGETINESLGNGLFCQIPLALYLSKQLQTEFSEKFNELKQQINQTTLEYYQAEEEITRIAAFVSTWNIIQHFYPYFEEVKIDWNQIFVVILQEILNSKNTIECYWILNKLLAFLQDGHGALYHPKYYAWNINTFPLDLAWLEDHLVIASESEYKELQVGDIVLQINNLNAKQALEQQEIYISGSPQWKRRKALHNFIIYDSLSVIKIKRENKIFEIQTSKIKSTKSKKGEKTKWIDKHIFYANLGIVTMDEIEAQIEGIAKAKGVIFDLRAYPASDLNSLVNYLTDKTVYSAFFCLPHIIYPNHKNIILDLNKTNQWVFKPKTPHIQGKVVFLANENAFSYSESLLSVIEYYKLALIIGSPTAGANGDRNECVISGGFIISWTGGKVIKQDGSQHHLIGIKPSINIKQTIRGLFLGKDEILERAIFEIRNN